jgi:hypothetical protein
MEQRRHLDVIGRSMVQVEGYAIASLAENNLDADEIVQGDFSEHRISVEVAYFFSASCLARDLLVIY